ncbi:hypothetical protein Taro_022233 [Colocasia esculenta]|uniref:Uncharacterized protein n=1 Tax=Colocasia esculenta TaxID=4460 RepID=A0A843UTU6_COLES|nr:hypothetical protein [Colocasia esculenta]
MSRSHEKAAAALNELKYFHEGIGSFGDPSAIASRQKLDPERGEMELDEEADDPDDPPRLNTFLVSAIERMQAGGDARVAEDTPVAVVVVVVVVVLVVVVVVVACAFHWSLSSRMLPKMVEITVLH